MIADELRIGEGDDALPALLLRPPGAWLLYVLAHGAGAGMRHSFMQALAAALGRRDVATLRYEFAYMAAGRRRPDPAPVCQAAVRRAVDAAARIAPDLPRIAGGKSMGGRMTSQAQAERPLPGVRGLAFVGFPLHPAKRPDVKRAAHLYDVVVPMLFLQGTRDALSDPELIHQVTAGIGPRATLWRVDGADHSFHVLKRSGRTDADVLEEIADALVAWARPLTEAPP